MIPRETRHNYWKLELFTAGMVLLVYHETLAVQNLAFEIMTHDLAWLEGYRGTSLMRTCTLP